MSDTKASAPRRLVLRGARYPGDIAISGGVVTEVGFVAPMAGDTELSCVGDIITAGLVNTTTTSTSG